MARTQTHSFTSGSIAAGASSNINRTGLPSLFDIVRIKVTPSVGGPTRLEIYQKDSFLTADRIHTHGPWQGVLNKPTEPPLDWTVFYEDEDSTGELHLTIYNDHASSANTYDVEIEYTEVPLFDSAGAVTFRGSIFPAVDSDKDIGSSALRWNQIYTATVWATQYGITGDVTGITGTLPRLFVSVDQSAHWGMVNVASGANTTGAQLAFFKTRSGSTDADTIVASGDSVGRLVFYGADGAAYQTAAAITAKIDASPGLTDMPGRLEFATTADASNSLTTQLIIRSTGAAEFTQSIFINDTSNVNMTRGFTVNQGSANDEAFAIKASSIAHGITDLAETNTYFTIGKFSPTAGAAELRGYGETTVGILIEGYYATDSTAKSLTGSDAAIRLIARKKDASTWTDPGADANLVAIVSGDGTRFILDADGDSHQDVGTAWTNFDAHDDIMLLNSLAVHVAREGDPIRANFCNWVGTNRADLEAIKLVTFNSDGHHFVNMSKLTMLHTGAIRQIGQLVKTIDEKIARYERALISLNIDPELLAT